MMNKYHWTRVEFETRFPIGAKVLYPGTTNPKLTGRKGVVTGYSQSGGVKVNFGACHAIVLPDKIATVPEENASRKEIEERFPIGVKVRCTDAQLCGYIGVVRGYSRPANIWVSFGAWGATVPPENLTVIPAPTLKDDRCLACFEKDDRYGHTCEKDTNAPKVEEPKPEVKSDVAHPNHYTLFDNVKAVEIIARSMSIEAFRGFCLGNVLKYRLRAGKKSEMATVEKALNKAAFYQDLFDKYKGLCHDAT